VAEANVEVVRRVYEAAARRDADAILGLYDRDVELEPSEMGVAGSYRGHDGLRRFFREWHEAWGSIEYDYEELIDAGDHVVAVVNRHATGRRSGVTVERPVFLVWTVRDGKVTRVVWYLTRAEAMNAAGVHP
jgi:ketosteroid isomerase-like protein